MSFHMQRSEMFSLLFSNHSSFQGYTWAMVCIILLLFLFFKRDIHIAEEGRARQLLGSSLKLQLLFSSKVVFILKHVLILPTSKPAAFLHSLLSQSLPTFGTILPQGSVCFTKILLQIFINTSTSVHHLSASLIQCSSFHCTSQSNEAQWKQKLKPLREKLFPSTASNQAVQVFSTDRWFLNFCPAVQIRSITEEHPREQETAEPNKRSGTFAATKSHYCMVSIAVSVPWPDSNFRTLTQVNIVSARGRLGGNP